LGAVALFVNVGIFSVAIYFGYRHGISFHDLVLSLRKAMDLDFFFFNFLCILIFCVIVYVKNIFDKYFFLILILALFVSTLNMFFISKNIISIFNIIFWAGTVYYLLKQRSNRQHREERSKKVFS
jgi:hypothetical protein